MFIYFLFNYIYFVTNKNVLLKLLINLKNIYLYNEILGIGDWGLGIGDWGFGPQTKTPKPKTQKPKPKKI
jgi:hypothetical protein